MASERGSPKWARALRIAEVSGLKPAEWPDEAPAGVDSGIPDFSRGKVSERASCGISLTRLRRPLADETLEILVGRHRFLRTRRSPGTRAPSASPPRRKVETTNPRICSPLPS